MFLWVFSCITAMVEKQKAKQGGGEMIREAVRKRENKIVIMVSFLSALCLVDLNMAFRHLKNIYLEKF